MVPSVATPVVLDQLAGAAHGDPFSILGPHVEFREHGEALVIRTLQLHAARVEVVRLDPSGAVVGTARMDRIHPVGIFEAAFSHERLPFRYRLRVIYPDSAVQELEDPYRFGRVVGDVDLHLSAGYSGTGEIVVRGRVRAPLAQDCRRCLEPVSSDFVGDITLVFVSGEGDGDVEDGDAYGFEPDGGELELGEAVREELILTVNPYVVCDPDCKGLCGTCGANLNETSCDCSDEATDPRWDALRVLKDK